VGYTVTINITIIF